MVGPFSSLPAHGEKTDLVARVKGKAKTHRRGAHWRGSSARRGRGGFKLTRKYVSVRLLLYAHRTCTPLPMANSTICIHLHSLIGTVQSIGMRTHHPRPRVTTAGLVRKGHWWIYLSGLSLAPEPIDRDLRLCFPNGHDFGRATKLPNGVWRQRLLQGRPCGRKSFVDMRAGLSLAPELIDRDLRLCFSNGHELGRATKLQGRPCHQDSFVDALLDLSEAPQVAVLPENPRQLPL